MEILSVEKLEEMYKQLETLNFPDILENLSVIDRKCSKNSQKCLLENRRIIYTLFAAEIAKSTKKKQFVDKILKCGNSKPKDGLVIFEPLEVQGITMVLKAIISNPPKLVESFLSLVGRNEFFSCAFATIPAIYSFFSTAESVGYAFKFYMELSQKANFDVFILAITPFFNSAMCSTFSTILFDKVFRDSSKKKCTNQEFCQIVVDDFGQSVRFLPEQVAILIRMLTLSWPLAKVWKLIARAFIIHQFHLQRVVNSLSYNDLVVIDDKIVSEILMSIGDEKSKYKLNLPDFDFSPPYKKIPETFVPYKSCFAIAEVFTVQDIMNILLMNIEASQHTKRLQKAIDEREFDPYESFSINFFPKMIMPPSMAYRSLFNFPSILTKCSDSAMLQIWTMFETAATSVRMDPFKLLKMRPIRTGNAVLDYQLNNNAINIDDLYKFGLRTKITELSTTASILEILLQHNMALSELEDWFNVCTSYLDKCSMFAAFDIVKNLKLKPETIVSSFWDIVQNNYFDSQKIGLWVAIRLLSEAKHLLIKKNMESFKAININYMNLIRSKIYSVAMPHNFTNAIIKSHLSGINDVLRFGEDAKMLFVRYELLLEFIEEVENLISAVDLEDSIDMAKEILNFSFVIGNNSWVLNTIILINACLLNDERFSSYAPSALIEKWRKFSAAFIQFLADNEQLVAQYGILSSTQLLAK